MKKLILLLFAVASFLSAQSDYQSELCPYQLIEQNYLEGLNSDNCGLRVSCAYFLGEMKSSKAVIPLMDLLNTCPKVEVRLIAALSLIKIDDKRGVFLVKRQAEFCDSERVRLMCERFYNAYMQNKYIEPSSLIAESSDELKPLLSRLMNVNN